MSGKRSLVHTKNTRAEPGQNPCPAAGRTAEIQAKISGTGHAAYTGKHLPKLEIGPVRRGMFVFSKVYFSVGKRTAARGGSQQQIPGPQGPCSHWSSGQRGAEHMRLCPDDRQRLLNKRCAAMFESGVKSPVPLYGFERCRSPGNGNNGNKSGRLPDVLRPYRMYGAFPGAHEALTPEKKLKTASPELVLKLRLEPPRRQIHSAGAIRDAYLPLLLLVYI